jgi:hypothetical protein
VLILFFLIYTLISTQLKREIVHRVYENFNKILEPELQELCLVCENRSLPPFLVTNEVVDFNEKLKECTIAIPKTNITSLSATIRIRLNYLDQSNLFHLFAMESSWWCIYLSVKNLEQNYSRIFIEPTGTEKIHHPFAIGMIKALSNHGSQPLADVYDVYGPGVAVYQTREFGQFKLPWPLWSYTTFYKKVKPHTLSMEMIKRIKDSCPKPVTNRSKEIILIDRKGSRRLVHNNVQDFARVVEFQQDDDFCQTVNLMRNTRVLIGVHGAGLTNLALLEPGSIVVEILMRTGFDQYYYKAEYANMARFFGMRYYYFDSESVSPLGCGIHCEEVKIDTKKLKRNILKIYNLSFSFFPTMCWNYFTTSTQRHIYRIITTCKQTQ